MPHAERHGMCSGRPGIGSESLPSHIRQKLLSKGSGWGVVSMSSFTVSESINAFYCKINTLLQLRYKTTIKNHNNAHTHAPPSPRHAFGQLWMAIDFWLASAKCFLDERRRHHIKSIKHETHTRTSASPSLPLPSLLLSWIGGYELAATPINHGNLAPPRYTAAPFIVGDKTRARAYKCLETTGWNPPISHWECCTASPSPSFNYEPWLYLFSDTY